MKTGLLITPSWTLPESELTFTAVRASGPGGQNVNKVNSKVEVRWNIHQSRSLPPLLKERILGKNSSRITASGDIVVLAGRFRDQPKNREDGITRMVTLLKALLHVPRQRKKTKPSKAAKEKRITAKKKRAITKHGRSSRGYE